MRQNSSSSPAFAVRHAARNRAALVLFGRAVVTTLAIVSGALGFLAGIQMQSDTYDPYAYATGVGALFAGACAVIAFMLTRRRIRIGKIRALEGSVEKLTDHIWELREAEERARSLLEAQGDLIVRRDAERPHHLRQRRLLRAGRQNPRRADRHRLPIARARAERDRRA